METLIVHPKTRKQLLAVEAVLNALNVNFRKEENKSYSQELLDVIEKGREDDKAGNAIKIKPADIWNLG